jgi:saccharopine dehydrogenase (NADP+, L-glutamate forming)
MTTAERVIAGRPRATAIALDVSSPDLDRYIKEHNVVVSLGPSYTTPG